MHRMHRMHRMHHYGKDFSPYSIRCHTMCTWYKNKTHSPRSHIRSHREMLSRSFPSSSSSSSSFSSRKPAAAAWANNRLDAPLPRPRLLAALWRIQRHDGGGGTAGSRRQASRARGRRRTTNALRLTPSKTTPKPPTPSVGGPWRWPKTPSWRRQSKKGNDHGARRMAMIRS